MPRMKNPSDDMSSRPRSRNRMGEDSAKSGMSRPARPSASPRTTGPMDMPARPPAPKPMGSGMSMAKGPSPRPMGMPPRPMTPGPQGAMKKPGYKKGGSVGCKTY